MECYDSRFKSAKEIAVEGIIYAGLIRYRITSQ